MATRRKGGLSLGNAIELEQRLPLDARTMVRTKEEMLDPESFAYGYNGMVVACREDRKLYMLIDQTNPTVEASWIVIAPSEGGGAADSVEWDNVQNKPTFATVATSGDFNDLTNRPVVPPAYDDTEVRGLIAAKANTADLAPVATSGSYNDLEDKPTIPEAYDDTVLAGRVTALENASPAAPAWDAITDKPTFATVATSGSYNDLSDQPTIPEAYDDTGLRNRVTALENKTETQSDWNESDSSSAAYIANKPTIPPAVTVDAAMSDTSENPVQNKVVLAAITDAVDVVEANVYTKAETDAKIAEAMTDVDNNHFHVVTALPDPSVAKEFHEYVLVTYAQDGTIIESETHYLFYDGVFHQRTTQISLDGYATEVYVDAATDALDTRVTAVEEALNLTALTDEEIAALVPA